MSNKLTIHRKNDETDEIVLRGDFDSIARLRLVYIDAKQHFYNITQARQLHAWLTQILKETETQDATTTAEIIAAIKAAKTRPEAIEPYMEAIYHCLDETAITQIDQAIEQRWSQSALKWIQTEAQKEVKRKEW